MAVILRSNNSQRLSLAYGALLAQVCQYRETLRCDGDVRGGGRKSRQPEARRLVSRDQRLRDMASLSRRQQVSYVRLPCRHALDEKF